MIHSIQTVSKTAEKRILFFKETDIGDHRVIPLFGANGSGKTTLLKGIEDTICAMQYKAFNEEYRDALESLSMRLSRGRVNRGHEAFVLGMDNGPAVMYAYRNSTDNFRVKEPSSYAQSFDPAFLVTKMNARALSEGQSVVYSAFGLFDTLKDRSNRDTHDAIVLIDELDSGLSLDNLDIALRHISELTESDRRLQIFFSFNTSYVLKYFPDVLSMYNGKWLHLESEEEMLKALWKNTAKLDRKRKDENGEYIIFD